MKSAHLVLAGGLVAATIAALGTSDGGEAPATPVTASIAGSPSPLPPGHPPIDEDASFYCPGMSGHGNVHVPDGDGTVARTSH